MRLLTLATVLLALVLVGCGDDEDGTPTTTSASTALPLTVERAGGVAGIRETLVVAEDGTGTVTTADGERTLTADDTAAVRSALRELVFDGLDETYGPPEDTQIADGIDYSFTAGGRTITVQEMAEDVPESLAALKAAAGEAMTG